MTRRLWLDPSFGASGDMVLGALGGLAVDLGLDDPDDERGLHDALTTLTGGGFGIARSPVTRAGISATRMEVTAEIGPARHWSAIDAAIAGAALPPSVRDGARRTFRLLGEVEAAQHAVDLDDVHFHEVGAVDAMVDIVGAWWLLDRLGIDEVVAGPVGLGHGTVQAAHGALPLPAPATLELLHDAPVRSLDADFETCTPTGAALLASMGTWGPIPDGRIVASARGAGGKDPAGHPNVLTAIVVDTSDRHGTADATVESAVVISTNVDDVTPELLGHLVDVVLDAGADDVWIVPVVMKKGRPAHQINALVRPDLAATIRNALGLETGTLGIRATPVTKYVAPRRTETVEVHGHTVRVKVGPHGAKAEHDDLVALSTETGLPIRRLAADALGAWVSGHRDPA